MSEKTYLLARKSVSTKAFAALKPKVLSTTKAIREAMKPSRRNDIWIAKSKSSLKQLVDVAQGLLAAAGTLVAFGNPPAEMLPLLHAMFANLLLPDECQAILDDEQLAEVLSAGNKADLFISGLVDKSRKRLILRRGDMSHLVVPFAAFNKALGGPAPDWGRLEITDYGHTVKLGDYEASSHGLLYEFDANYRRRAKKRRRELAKGFGPSLWRLRILKRLSQSDFSPQISSRTLARIEKGECKPREKTIRALAKRLGVQPDEIESF